MSNNQKQPTKEEIAEAERVKKIMETPLERHEILEYKQEVMKGIVHLVRKKQFYGHIVQQIEKIFEGHPIQTFAVGRREGEILLKLFVSLNFVKTIYDKEKDQKKSLNKVIGVLEHEILHIVFSHLNMKFTDGQRGNIACDCSVNSYIKEDMLPSSPILPERYGFPKGESAHWYYNNLKDNEKYQEDCENGSYGPGGEFELELDSHSSWEELMDDEFLGDFIKDMVKKSKELCNEDYGNIPGEVIAQIGELLKKDKPLIPWNKALRNFCAQNTESEINYTMKRKSKRFGSRPGTKKEEILDVAVGLDTSASMSDEDIKIALNEIRWIWKNGVKVTIYECDTQIGDIYQFKGKFKGTVTGRGGTDLKPVLEQMKKNKKHDCMIYFTDFYAPEIQEHYRIPTFWVLNSEIPVEQFPYKQRNALYARLGKGLVKTNFPK